MDRILVSVSTRDRLLAQRIHRALEQNREWNLCESPVAGGSYCSSEVVVIDQDTFERLPLPLDHPERVVLIARKDRVQLERAWEAGIISVVWDTDRIETVFLAIQAAALRCHPPLA